LRCVNVEMGDRVFDGLTAGCSLGGFAREFGRVEGEHGEPSPNERLRRYSDRGCVLRSAEPMAEQHTGSRFAFVLWFVEVADACRSSRLELHPDRFGHDFPLSPEAVATHGL